MVVQEFYLPYEDTDISFRSYTQSDLHPAKPTLIFLHDALGCIKSWREFPRDLCALLNCHGVMYDRLGHGNSGALNQKRSIDYLESEACQILPFIIKQLNLESPVLVGCSDGATIALIYASRQNKCAGIISIAGHIKVEDITLEGIRSTIRKLQSPGPLQRLRDLHGEKTEKVIKTYISLNSQIMKKKH